jgi:steroid delta-isomerase-like uncharacterized protein
MQDRNKEIARRFMGAWNAGGAGIVDALAAPDFVARYSHFPAPAGASEFKALLAQTHTSFPDLHVTIDEMIAEGDRVAVAWHYEGTHEEGEVFGAAPAGRRVRVAGITTYRIAGGLVVEEYGVVDNLSLMGQLQSEAEPKAHPNGGSA